MITKTQLISFRNDFKSAVKELEEKYNLVIEIGGIIYNEIDFHTKMTCTSKTDSGEKKVDLKEFDMLKRLYGFLGNIGDTYTERGYVYKIMGLDSRKPKYPVMLQRNDGKLFKSTVSAINALLKGIGK